MIDEIKKLIDEELETNILELRELESDDAPVEEIADKRETITMLHNMRKEELTIKSERFSTIMKACTDTLSVVVPATVYMVWMKKGFKFEETGTITSSTFKGLITKFKPGK